MQPKRGQIALGLFEGVSDDDCQTTAGCSGHGTGFTQEGLATSVIQTGAAVERSTSIPRRQLPALDDRHNVDAHMPGGVRVQGEGESNDSLSMRGRRACVVK